MNKIYGKRYAAPAGEATAYVTSSEELAEVRAQRELEALYDQLLEGDASDGSDV
ncbi:p43 [Xanthomonas phage Xop411]|uniref:p43 n=1 Tax=Xanthomonas phage Xop411 TaxID=2913975 RepID=A5H1L3_9CAUD|nr:p43 [Xanthomonas phage Xop411]ABK00190.1 p43 [Xanthomonas phage Xop411]